MSMMKCNVCSCDFDIESEGGVDGNFGILPVSFCPTCYSCMCDMADQAVGDDGRTEYDAGWDECIDAVIEHMHQELKQAFGADTLASFEAYLKGFKNE